MKLIKILKIVLPLIEIYSLINTIINIRGYLIFENNHIYPEWLAGIWILLVAMLFILFVSNYVELCLDIYDNKFFNELTQLQVLFSFVVPMYYIFITINDILFFRGSVK